MSSRRTFLLIPFSRLIYRRLVNAVNHSQRVGLRVAVDYSSRRPMLLVGMLVFGIFAALFEGGTLAILGAAVASLSDDASQGLHNMPIGSDLPDFEALQELSKGGWFLLLVSVAVGMQVVKSLMTYLSEVVQVKLTYGLQKFAQGSIIHDVMTRSYVQIGAYPSGHLAGLVDQSASLADLISIFGKTVRALCMLVIYGLTMLYLSWPMTGIALVIFAGLWWGMNSLVTQIRSFSETAASEQISTWRNTIEFLNAPRLLRILNTEDEAESMIEAARKRWIRAEEKTAILIAAIIPSFEAITVIGAGIFLVVSYFFSGETANDLIPKLFVFVLVFFRLKPQVQMLNTVRLQFVRLLPRIENTGRFLGAKDVQHGVDGRNKVARFNRSIQFDTVSFRYPDTEVNAIEKITFSVSRGEMVALVGESGAGKSTIVNLLLGLYRPDSGGILIDGQNLNDLNLADWRSQLGVVDQDVFLLNSTVARNISFGRGTASDIDVEEAAKLAFAHEFILDLPNGYQTTIGDRGYRLSGGQKQRLAIARAILHNPDILILDEATSALDSISEKAVQKSLSEMHRYRTMVVIAHRLTTIEKADKIIVIESGRVLEVGSQEELMKIEDGKYRSFLLA